MKNRTTLKLNIERVLQRIHTHTYYTGQSRKNAGFAPMAAAQLQSSPDDSHQLTDHLRVACTEASQLLSNHLSICHTKNIIEENNQETILFILDVPGNYPIESLNELEQAIENYAVARTLHQWLLQHKPDENILIANEAQQHLNTLRQIATLRKRPQRRKKLSEKIIDI